VSAEEASLPFDVRKPNVARVYDFLLGGKDNFQADRDEARRILAVYPGLTRLMRDNRVFLGRAVTALVGAGITQFLDLGSGLPTTANTHEVAKAANSAARVVYVDDDPVVVNHARVLLKAPDVAAAQADITDPAAVFALPEVRELIRLDEPVAVILASVLHFFDPQTMRRVLSGYLGPLVPGSYVALSWSWTDPGFRPKIAREYTAASFWHHSREDLREALAGLELLDPPGIAEARHWMAGQPAAEVDDPVHFFAAVARKP
jgi:O-methyltransferase involved in polyketide biosynthesis